MKRLLVLVGVLAMACSRHPLEKDDGGNAGTSGGGIAGVAGRGAAGAGNGGSAVAGCGRRCGRRGRRGGQRCGGAASSGIGGTASGGTGAYPGVGLGGIGGTASGGDRRHGERWRQRRDRRRGQRWRGWDRRIVGGVRRWGWCARCLQVAGRAALRAQRTVRHRPVHRRRLLRERVRRSVRQLQPTRPRRPVQRGGAGRTGSARCLRRHFARDVRVGWAMRWVGSLPQILRQHGLRGGDVQRRHLFAPPHLRRRGNLPAADVHVLRPLHVHHGREPLWPVVHGRSAMYVGNRLPERRLRASGRAAALREHRAAPVASALRASAARRPARARAIPARFRPPPASARRFRTLTRPGTVRPEASSPGSPAWPAPSAPAAQCVDGVCCDGACLGPCRSCNLAASAGRCMPVASGAPDPRGVCVAMSPATCGLDGTCDGSGACRKWAVGSICAAATCSGDVFTPPSVCNGAAHLRAAGAGLLRPLQVRPAELHLILHGRSGVLVRRVPERSVPASGWGGALPEQQRMQQRHLRSGRLLRDRLPGPLQVVRSRGHRRRLHAGPQPGPVLELPDGS